MTRLTRATCERCVAVVHSARVWRRNCAKQKAQLELKNYLSHSPPPPPPPARAQVDIIEREKELEEKNRSASTASAFAQNKLPGNAAPGNAAAAAAEDRATAAGRGGGGSSSNNNDAVVEALAGKDLGFWTRLNNAINQPVDFRLSVFKKKKQMSPPPSPETVGDARVHSQPAFSSRKAEQKDGETRTQDKESKSTGTGDKKEAKQEVEMGDLSAVTAPVSSRRQPRESIASSAGFASAHGSDSVV